MKYKDLINQGTLQKKSIKNHCTKFNSQLKS